ncbi:hypothetical protein AR687_14680 [Flavobacteriaceae bacterium CRH]|nr:hypothetical protein AR687_14680 [Flavobacteriaceae bacterium CRH]
MEKKVGSMEDIIYHGLNTVDNKSKVTLDLKDFLLIYRTIEELRRFFHNQDHYPNLKTIHKFLGDRDSGMMSIIDNIYLDVLDKHLNKESEKILEFDAFHAGLIPFYYIKTDDLKTE